MGCQNSITSRDQVVFVDETAEHITPADAVRGEWTGRRTIGSWLWWEQRERPVRPVRVVVLEVDLKHAGEVTRTDDQQVIETLPANGADPALTVSIGIWGPDRGTDDRGPTERHTSSKDRVNLASRSRVK